MSIGSVSSGTQAADLLKILESGQEKSIDLAKKMVKAAVAEKVQSVSSSVLDEALGQNLDTYA